MDAAAAAAMSDPDRNPHFRRRWSEASAGGVSDCADPANGQIGTLGLALLEAFARRKAAAARPHDPDGGSK